MATNGDYLTDAYNMFNGNNSLQTIPQLDTSKVTNMENMFRDCNSLRSIPQLDTSKVTNMSYMFYNCYNLRNINAPLDLSSITNQFNPSIPTYNEDVELSVSFVANTINCNVYFSPNLTVDSLLSLIAGLVDLTGQESKNLVIGSQNIAKLTDAQKNAITAKNWTYS